MKHEKMSEKEEMRKRENEKTRMQGIQAGCDQRQTGGNQSKMSEHSQLPACNYLSVLSLSSSILFSPLPSRALNVRSSYRFSRAIKSYSIHFYVSLASPVRLSPAAPVHQREAAIGRRTEEGKNNHPHLFAIVTRDSFPAKFPAPQVAPAIYIPYPLSGPF